MSAWLKAVRPVLKLMNVLTTATEASEIAVAAGIPSSRTRACGASSVMPGAGQDGGQNSGNDSPVLNGLAIAVDLAALGDLGSFTAEIDKLHDAIAALPRAEGVERILLPGERGDAIKDVREATGIPIPPGTWKRLSATAAALGVRAPRSGG